MIKTIVLSIKGMHCISCAMDIDGELEDNGVKCAKTNYAKSKTEVEFDENRINEEKIIQIIKKTGYEALPES